MIPCSDAKVSQVTKVIQESSVRYEAWLHHVSNIVKKEKLNEEDVATWSSYNAGLQTNNVRPRAEIGIFPLFIEKVHSPCRVKHFMEIVRDGTEFLNPGQTPVIGMDQPLYSLAKKKSNGSIQRP